ncbi:hypothetical protein L596_022694 [Steinernema carpocapsae]|uniref:Uncharacterized protein n=1 Tax=Steinernema carpocapsae TaxID=34508 RepID=A0A4V6A0A4_STECR|nr:hypothetical protein L596_022694 [Steinernema carpocapsae]
MDGISVEFTESVINQFCPGDPTLRHFEAVSSSWSHVAEKRNAKSNFDLVISFAEEGMCCNFKNFNFGNYQLPSLDFSSLELRNVSIKEIATATSQMLTNDDLKIVLKLLRQQKHRLKDVYINTVVSHCETYLPVYTKILNSMPGIENLYLSDQLIKHWIVFNTHRLECYEIPESLESTLIDFVNSDNPIEFKGFVKKCRTGFLERFVQAVEKKEGKSRFQMEDYMKHPRNSENLRWSNGWLHNRGHGTGDFHLVLRKECLKCLKAKMSCQCPF